MFQRFQAQRGSECVFSDPDPASTLVLLCRTPDNKTTEDLTWQVETSPKPKAKSGWKKSMYVHHTFDACVMLCAQEQSTNLIYSCPPPQSEHKKMPQNHKKTTFNPTSGETLNELISKVKGVTK